MELLKSYIDANLILNAFSDQPDIVRKVMGILTDSARDLMVSDYVELETLPKMRYFKQEEQVMFTEGVLHRSIYIHSSDAIVKQAHYLANTYGLSCIDAAATSLPNTRPPLSKAARTSCLHSRNRQSPSSASSRGYCG